MRILKLDLNNLFDNLDKNKMYVTQACFDGAINSSDIEEYFGDTYLWTVLRWNAQKNTWMALNPLYNPWYPSSNEEWCPFYGESGNTFDLDLLWVFECNWRGL